MALNLKTSRRPTGPAPRPEGDNFRVPSARGLLSAEEIEALLRPDIPENAFEKPETVHTAPMEELEVQSGETPLDVDAGILASRLTLALRRACGIDAIARVESARNAPLSYLVSRHIGDPVLVLFCNEQGVQTAGLTLESNLAAKIIEQSCGGSATAHPTQAGRLFSMLDRLILQEILNPIAEAIDPSWTIGCIETSRSAAHALLPPGKAVLAELVCEISGINGRAAFATLLPEPSADVTATAIAQETGRLQVQLTARLASLSVPLSRLTDLKAGSVLLLGLPTDQPVQLLTGGHQGEVVAEGSVGRRGNKVAVQVTTRKPTTAH